MTALALEAISVFSWKKVFAIGSLGRSGRRAISPGPRQLPQSERTTIRIVRRLSVRASDT